MRPLSCTLGDDDQLIAGLNINVQPGFAQIAGQAHAARSIPKVFASARAYVQAGLAKYVFNLSCYIQAFAIEDIRAGTGQARQRSDVIVGKLFAPLLDKLGAGPMFPPIEAGYVRRAVGADRQDG